MAKKNATRNAAVRIPSALIVTLVIVIGLVFAAVMLYPSARDYYLVKREHERREAEYQAVIDRNEKIQEQIDELSTLEGIADLAREKFGWVEEGEEAVNITGLTISESSTGLPSAVEPGSIEAPEDWWTQTLDEFFGFDKESPEVLPSDEVVPGL